MADIDEFKKAVHDACECFDAQDWPKLESMLDDHVVMKRIDDPEKCHSGKRDVMHYFNTRGDADRARFEYDPNDQNTKWLIVNGPKPIGVISGTGKFYDTDKAIEAKKPRTIAFSFSFVKDGQKWLAIHLWGAYAS